MKDARKMLDQGFTAPFSAATAESRLDMVIRDAIGAGGRTGPGRRRVEDVN